MKCPTCGGEMKPLMVSWFCPKDCDRPKPAAATDDLTPTAYYWSDGPWSLGTWASLDGLYLFGSREDARAWGLGRSGCYFLLGVTGVTLDPLGQTKDTPRRAKYGGKGLKGRIVYKERHA